MIINELGVMPVERLILKSEIQNINLVEKLIDEVSVKYSIDSEVYGKLLLAVVEGVNNAIVHGNKLVKERDVVIEYEISDSEIYFQITDMGDGFDYTCLPDPTLPENIERTHGRGIFLMNHLADKLEFNDKGNQLKMFFRLS
ncbi:ATP-binding protein [Xiashengella succiniciproducens]|jgi:serine/threonine-protein kinase RsbW|uniref:ATP-binding protein n=1 Tax=Xiashengella succiniciproducens TaxID=2949635 RepID=A0A9J6ZQE4_9BACT|nr:ATP-binding protein [Alkaliflexus sp. Ai-910]URW79815.1 ATP-binding protein [Alkaliflexus sp. Ai-910]